MFAFHLLFSYGSCRTSLRVKMESIYIYSVFMWGRHGGLVECLSYWHTCCVSNGSTETQWHWLGAAVCHVAPLCVYMPSAANSVTCWHYSVGDSLWFHQMKSQTESCVFDALCRITDSSIIYLHLTLCLFFCPERWTEVCSHYCAVCSASNGF